MQNSNELTCHGNSTRFRFVSIPSQETFPSTLKKKTSSKKKIYPKRPFWDNRNFYQSAIPTVQFFKNISIASLHLDTSRTWMTWFSLLMRHKSDANTKPAKSAAHGLAANQHTVSPTNQLLPRRVHPIVPIAVHILPPKCLPCLDGPSLCMASNVASSLKGMGTESLHACTAHHQWRVFTLNGARTRRTDWA